MATKNNLTDAQLKDNRDAIHAYIAQATALNGRGSVILLPEFEEDANGKWAPVQGKGTRPTATGGSFLRFGKMTINPATGKIQYLYTNHFGDSEEDLLNMMLFIAPTATVGSAIRGIRLVIHEQTTAFSRKDPSRDIKWADKKAGIQCLKLDEASGEMQTIYRRTKVFFADDEGNYPDNARNILLQHDNGAEISENGFQKWNAANTPAIKNASPVAAPVDRLAELQAIPKANRTAAEKAELAELMD